MSTVIFNTKEDDLAREPVLVRQIFCPVHGDVTEEVGVKNENNLWPIYATIKLLRSGAVHHHERCNEQLLWELGEQASSMGKHATPPHPPTEEETE